MKNYRIFEGDTVDLQFDIPDEFNGGEAKLLILIDKVNGAGIVKTQTVENSSVTFELQEGDTYTRIGSFPYEVRVTLEDEAKVAEWGKFVVDDSLIVREVEPTELETLTIQLQNYYTKSEVDTMMSAATGVDFSEYRKVSDSYSRVEADGKYAEKETLEDVIDVSHTGFKSKLDTLYTAKDFSHPKSVVDGIKELTDTSFRALLDNRFTAKDYSYSKDYVTNRFTAIKNLTDNTFKANLDDRFFTKTIANNRFYTQTQINGFMDDFQLKQPGKGLSTNDFTSALRDKLIGLENYDDTNLQTLIGTKEPKLPNTPANPANKFLNANRQWVEITGTGGGGTGGTGGDSYSKEEINGFLAEKEGLLPPEPSYPLTKFLNGNKQWAQIDFSKFYTKETMNNLLGDKVDTIEGKGLSENDFTNALKTKLTNLENYDDSAILTVLGGKEPALPVTPPNPSMHFLDGNRVWQEIKHYTSAQVDTLLGEKASKSRVETIEQNMVPVQEFLSYPSGEFVGTFSAQVEMWNSANFRRVLTVTNGHGNIHIDCKGKGGTYAYGSPETIIMELPSNAPTPVTTYEVQLFDGNSVWIQQGERYIRSSHLDDGVRYIFDIWGDFRN